jgi:hypothetical protein
MNSPTAACTSLLHLQTHRSTLGQLSRTHQQQQMGGSRRWSLSIFHNHSCNKWSRRALHVIPRNLRSNMSIARFIEAYAIKDGYCTAREQFIMASSAWTSADLVFNVQPKPCRTSISISNITSSCTVYGRRHQIRTLIRLSFRHSSSLR